MAKIYKVKDSQTGQIIEVPEAELSKYGISVPSETPTQQPNTSFIDTQSPQKTITGYTLKEHTQALDKARMAGDTAAIKTITDDYNREYQYQKDFETPNKKETDAQNYKKEVVGIAQKLQETIADKNKYTPDEYKSIIDSYTSALTTKQKEAANFGASLTANELAILAGQIPVRQEIGPSVSSLFNQYLNPFTQGQKPVQTGRVVDSDEEMMRKLKILIPQLSGKDITPQTFDQDNQTQSSQDSFLGGLLGNAKTNVNDLISGLVQAPGNIIKQAQEDALSVQQETDPLQRILKSVQGFVRPGAQMIGGVVEEANQLLGRPLEGGDILGRIGQRVYEKPVNTLLDVLPFLKVGKVSTASKVGEAADATKAATGGLLSNLKGRAATAVGIADKESVVKSEALMSDALKMTKSVTPRGMAKEMNAIIPKAGEFIDSHISKVDNVIGPQAGDDIVGQVMQKLQNRSELTANPNFKSEMQNILKGQLDSGQTLPGGLERGDVWSTNMIKVNDTRKYLNSGLNNWFKAGQPSGSPTNDLNALKWEASNELRNILSEADQSGLVKKAINLQHVALQTEPTLSQQALAGSQGGFGIYRTALNTINSIITPAKVAGARALQGVNPLIDEILNGKNMVSPLPQTATEGLMSPIPRGVGVIQKPVPMPQSPQTEIIRTLLRDKRFKQGNVRFKGGQ